MKLIGMLDSPYVRRVAISLDLLGVDFERDPLSVFSTFEVFSRINPVVKAPTLLLDDGSALMDSTLIIDYFETLAIPARKLLPSDPQALARALPDVARADDFPSIQAHAARLEQTELFKRYPIP